MAVGSMCSAGAVLLLLQVNCELDRAGLGSFAFNAIEFSCPVDQDKEPNIQVGMRSDSFFP